MYSSGRIVAKEDLYKQRARRLLGASRLSIKFEDFQSPVYYTGSNNDQGGTIVQNSTTQDVIRFTTTATVNSRGGIYLHQGQQPMFDMGTSAEWYVAICLKTNFAANAAPTAGITYPTGNTQVFSMGYHGPSSTTGWTVRANSASLSGGTYAANTWARLEVARVGGTTYFYVDGVLVNQGDIFPVGDPPVLALELSNNASAVARELDVDEVCFAVKSFSTAPL